MSTTPPRQNGSSADVDGEPGAYLEGYDEPVVVRSRLRADGVYHDADETEIDPAPECHFASRGDRWSVRELATLDDLEKCKCCRGDNGGGPAGGYNECLFCGEEVHAAHWPKHISECDG